MNIVAREVMDFLNFFRPASPTQTGAAGLAYLGKEATAPKFDTGVIKPLEYTVLDRITNLAGLVEWDSDIAVMKRPERLLTRGSWIKKLVYYLLTSPVVSLVAIRQMGGINELHVFSDAIKPFVDDRGRYTYTDHDKTYSNIHPRDILQFSGTMAYDSGRIETLRDAEDVFWTRWDRANVHEGFVMAGDESAALVAGTLEEQAATLSKLSTDMAKSPLVLLPRGFTSPPRGGAGAGGPRAELKVLYETIIRQWCHFYGLPSSIMNLDLPTHTQVSMVAAYGSFLRNKLIPLLRPVWEAIEIFMDGEITPDYSAVERASDAERAETGKNLAQTGYWTINELRERDGLPSRADGDEYPRVAGAPDKDSESDQGGQNDED